MFECQSFQPWLLNNPFYPISEVETASLKETQINEAADYDLSTRIEIRVKRLNKIVSPL